MAAAEVGELPALGCGDEQVTCVRVRERRARSPNGVGMLELPDRTIGAVPAGDYVVSLEAESDVHRLEAVQPPRQLRGVDPRAGEAVDLPGAIRGGDDDLAVEIREGLLQAGDVPHRSLPVIGEEDDGIALEERVGPARCVEQRADRGIRLLERSLGGFPVGPGGVGGEVVAGEVEGE